MEESFLFIVVVSLCILAFTRSFFDLLFFYCKRNKHSKKLPPGPQSVPLIGSFLWLRKSFSELEPILRNLRSKYGPLLTLQIGSRPSIFVGDHSLAHRALIQNGAVFSDRPRALPTNQVLTSNQYNISSAAYGPTWRLLRRNLTSQILHPSRIRSYSRARHWVLETLLHRLLKSSDSSNSRPAVVKVVDHFQYAMFCLLVLMCFGDKLHETQIKKIEKVQRDILLSFGRFNILNFLPRVGRLVFRKRWEELKKLRQNQEDVLIPLIRARAEAMKQKKKKEEEEESENVVAYVDTLLDLELPEEKRKLEVDEMVSLCSEFLNAGTDTTSTALQWIMANLVKYPWIQAKLFKEISGVVGPPPPPAIKEEDLQLERTIREEDLQGMKYLKAVVLEGLRRHPPGHFVLPHSVSEDVEFDGYLIPKNTSINFMVAEMGWDPKVWDEPMEFKPERFLSHYPDRDGAIAYSSGELSFFDVSGSREIKMMPFGAGRRICPASGLAMLHLEYFVANLIWYFHWAAAADVDVDLSEKMEFTVVMKNPLHAHISPRF